MDGVCLPIQEQVSAEADSVQKQSDLTHFIEHLKVNNERHLLEKITLPDQVSVIGTESLSEEYEDFDLQDLQSGFIEFMEAGAYSEKKFIMRLLCLFKKSPQRFIVNICLSRRDLNKTPWLQLSMIKGCFFRLKLAYVMSYIRYKRLLSSYWQKQQEGISPYEMKKSAQNIVAQYVDFVEEIDLQKPWVDQGLPRDANVLISYLEKKSPKDVLEEEAERIEWALFVLIHQRGLNLVQALFSQRDKFGRIGMCFSVHNKHMKITQFLLDMGLGVNDKDANGFSLLVYALSQTALSMQNEVSHLLCKGALVNCTQSWLTPLLQACRRDLKNPLETIATLLGCNASAMPKVSVKFLDFSEKMQDLLSWLERQHSDEGSRLCLQMKRIEKKAASIPQRLEREGEAVSTQSKWYQVPEDAWKCVQSFLPESTSLNYLENPKKSLRETSYFFYHVIENQCLLIQNIYLAYLQESYEQTWQRILRYIAINHYPPNHFIQSPERDILPRRLLAWIMDEFYGINRRDSDGYTPIMRLMKKKRNDQVLQLLFFQPNIDVTNHDGHSFLDLAQEADSLVKQVDRILQKETIRPDDYKQYVTLMYHDHISPDRLYAVKVVAQINRMEILRNTRRLMQEQGHVCSYCKDLLVQPLKISCGHIACMHCILKTVDLQMDCINAHKAICQSCQKSTTVDFTQNALAKKLQKDFFEAYEARKRDVWKKKIQELILDFTGIETAQEFVKDRGLDFIASFSFEDIRYSIEWEGKGYIKVLGCAVTADTYSAMRGRQKQHILQIATEKQRQNPQVRLNMNASGVIVENIFSMRFYRKPIQELRDFHAFLRHLQNQLR